jgi:hypothetical protein
LVASNNPSHFPDCRNRFGNSAKPYKKLPERSRDEWIDLIKTILPAPVRANADGDLLAGDPVTVIVRVEADAIRILVARLEWQNPYPPPALKGQPFAKIPLGATTARVAELNAKGWVGV